MNNFPFFHPNYLYSLFESYEYPDIQKFCLINKHTASICRNDPIILQLIRKKKNEYSSQITDNFLKSLSKTAIHELHILELIITSNLNESQRLIILKELLRRNYNLKGALTLASKYGKNNIVKLLLMYLDSNQITQESRSLAIAIYYGKYDTANILLQDSRIDPSVNNNDALNEAIDHHNLYLVNRILQDPRVDLSINNNQILRENLNLINLLNSRMNPNDIENLTVTIISKNILRRLLQDVRIRQNLSSEQLKTYLNIVGYIFPPPTNFSLLAPLNIPPPPPIYNPQIIEDFNFDYEPLPDLPED